MVTSYWVPIGCQSPHICLPHIILFDPHKAWGSHKVVGSYWEMRKLGLKEIRSLLAMSCNREVIKLSIEVMSIWFPRLCLFNYTTNKILQEVEMLTGTVYGLVGELTVLQGTLRVRAGTKGEQKEERSWTVPLCAEWKMRQGADIRL